MKIVLMSMPDISALVVHQSAVHMPNLGIASIGGNIDEKHSVYLIDLIRKRGKIKKYLTKTLRKINPDLIGLSAMSWQYDTCIKIITLIKEDILPDVKIAIGGYHATLLYEEICNSPEAKYIDYVIRGEGEVAFNELVKALENGNDFSHIAGVSYKENGNFIHNQRSELLDLEQIKMPIRDKRRLTKGYHLFFSKVETIETTRGCTRGCHFCSMNHMYGRSFRKYSVETVLRNIDYIYYKNKARWAFIVDDNVVLDPNHVIKLCDEIIKRKYKKLKIIVQCDSTMMAKREDMVEKMSQAGVRIVFLGIENGSKKNLEKMNKGNIVELSKKAVANCKKHGIAITGGLISGLPDDDEQSIKENFEFAAGLDIEAFLCQIITPYPKTKMRDDLLQAGLVTNFDGYKWYEGSFANVKTYNLSADELQYLHWYFKQTILGFWEPKGVLRKEMKVYTFFFNKMLKPIFKLIYRKRTSKIGWRGRFGKEMQRLEKMNYFIDIEDFIRELDQKKEMKEKSVGKEFVLK